VPWFSELGKWEAATPEPIRSEHLGRPHVAQVRLSPEARATYLGLVADDYPVGSVILEVLREVDTNRPGPVLALERTEAEWRYWVLDTEGRPDPAHAESLELCARCHAAAPSAPVFGLPRSPPPAPSPGASP